MQITIKTHNQITFDKIMSVLTQFRLDDVEIISSGSMLNATRQAAELTDDYIDAHWQKLIITHSMSDDYELTGEYKNDYGAYLDGKHQ